MTVDTIDLSPVIEQAGGRGQMGEAYKRATEFLSDWHGVFAEGETVILAQSGKCRAIARIAKTGRGHWLSGHDYFTPTSGSGGGPNVWARLAFQSRDDAIRYEAERAFEWFRGIVDTRDSCVSDATKRDAERILGDLRQLVTPTFAGPQQLMLF
ncbi:MAG: hypothetical protein BGO51_03745 [Rhodospirillales bacterium 69-11]|nr:hypothetical protein [Rhodospirillales bacterium]OJW28400.1 MAG: hypothetical protein BGO51_03745 [Rhodospirillales bacterium 69-11]